MWGALIKLSSHLSDAHQRSHCGFFILHTFAFQLTGSLFLSKSMNGQPQRTRLLVKPVSAFPGISFAKFLFQSGFTLVCHGRLLAIISNNYILVIIMATFVLLYTNTPLFPENTALEKTFILQAFPLSNPYYILKMYGCKFM